MGNVQQGLHKAFLLSKPFLLLVQGSGLVLQDSNGVCLALLSEKGSDFPEGHACLLEKTDHLELQELL